MLQKVFIVLTLLIVFCGSVCAMPPIDEHILTRCGLVCNGENDDCETCYNEAVDLYDQSDPTSPHASGGFHDNDGRFEFEF
ncbi:MAG: hypothetical protein K2P93_03205 [Alphaproteobacteria bacterium]|nr:hypothetical protein [Alphaproteobacteria bacterium]